MRTLANLLPTILNLRTSLGVALQKVGMEQPAREAFAKAKPSKKRVRKPIPPLSTEVDSSRVVCRPDPAKFVGRSTIPILIGKDLNIVLLTGPSRGSLYSDTANPYIRRQAFHLIREVA